MKRALACLASFAAVAAAPIAAHAASASCRIPPFRGAATAAGAVATMNVVNTGEACSITSYGRPAENANPAETGEITSPAAHGRAVFEAPTVRYTPAPGYVGDDAFDYRANAKGQLDQRVLLKVHVIVHVTAPQ